MIFDVSKYAIGANQPQQAAPSYEEQFATSRGLEMGKYQQLRGMGLTEEAISYLASRGGIPGSSLSPEAVRAINAIASGQKVGILSRESSTSSYGSTYTKYGLELNPEYTTRGYGGEVIGDSKAAYEVAGVLGQKLGSTQYITLSLKGDEGHSFTIQRGTYAAGEVGQMQREADKIVGETMERKEAYNRMSELEKETGLQYQGTKTAEGYNIRTAPSSTISTAPDAITVKVGEPIMVKLESGETVPYSQLPAALQMQVRETFGDIERQADEQIASFYGVSDRYYSISEQGILEDTGLGLKIQEHPEKFGLSPTTIFTEKGGITATPKGALDNKYPELAARFEDYLHPKLDYKVKAEGMDFRSAEDYYPDEFIFGKTTTGGMFASIDTANAQMKAEGRDLFGKTWEAGYKEWIKQQQDISLHMGVLSPEALEKGAYLHAYGASARMETSKPLWMEVRYPETPIALGYFFGAREALSDLGVSFAKFGVGAYRGYEQAHATGGEIGKALSGKPSDILTPAKESARAFVEPVIWYGFSKLMTAKVFIGTGSVETLAGTKLAQGVAVDIGSLVVPAISIYSGAEKYIQTGDIGKAFGYGTMTYAIFESGKLFSEIGYKATKNAEGGILKTLGGAFEEQKTFNEKNMKEFQKTWEKLSPEEKIRSAELTEQYQFEQSKADVSANVKRATINLQKANLPETYIEGFVKIGSGQSELLIGNEYDFFQIYKGERNFIESPVSYAVKGAIKIEPIGKAIEFKFADIWYEKPSVQANQMPIEMAKGGIQPETSLKLRTSGVSERPMASEIQTFKKTEVSPRKMARTKTALKKGKEVIGIKKQFIIGLKKGFTNVSGGNLPATKSTMDKLFTPIAQRIIERQVQRIGTRMEQKSGQRIGERIGQRVGEKIGQKVGQKVGQRIGERIGQRVGEKIGQKVGQKVGQRIGERIGQRVGERVGQRVSQKVEPRLDKLLKTQQKTTSLNKTQLPKSKFKQKPIISIRGAYASPEQVWASVAKYGKATNPSFEESIKLEAKYGIGRVPTIEGKGLKSNMRRGKL